MKKPILAEQRSVVTDQRFQRPSSKFGVDASQGQAFQRQTGSQAPAGVAPPTAPPLPIRNPPGIIRPGEVKPPAPPPGIYPKS